MENDKISITRIVQFIIKNPLTFSIIILIWKKQKKNVREAKKKLIW